MLCPQQMQVQQDRMPKAASVPARSGAQCAGRFPFGSSSQ